MEYKYVGKTVRKPLAETARRLLEMEEYHKEDWMNSEESPCHKCSSQGNCKINCGCMDWRNWYRKSVKKK